MEAKAEQTFARISPRKVRIVAKALQTLTPAECLVRLKFTNKKAAGILYKVVKQAIDSATRDGKLKAEQLKFKEILVNPGPILKRWRAAARGRGTKINKKTCHIKIILSN